MVIGASEAGFSPHCFLCMLEGAGRVLDVLGLDSVPTSIS